MNAEGVSRPAADGAAAIKALFNAVKEMLSPRPEEDAPQPARRRRGETGKGFVAAWKTMLRRVERCAARATGGGATFADICAEAGVFLSETLDYLNSFEDTTSNDCWHEDEFGATYWDYFPQP